MKKLLALVLALVMSMSLVTISNAAFKDADKISNKEAVDVMAAVGVLAGYDNGEFGATDTLTRAQACKIIAYLDLGKDVAEALPAVQVFSDLPANNWAAKYVAYCADAGYVSGVGDNKFAPDEKVTGYQFGKMLLCALGYDATIEEMTGASWTIKVAKLMEKNSISKGTSKLGAAVLTREEAAQYALNALKADMVEYDEKGSTITAGDVTIITGAKKAQTVTSNDAKYGKIDDEHNDTSKVPYTVQLGEKLYDGKLLIATTSEKKADDLGHPAHTWEYKDKKIGTYADTADYTVIATKAYAGLMAAYIDKIDDDADAKYSVPTQKINGRAWEDSDKDASGNYIQAGDVIEYYLKDGKITAAVVTRYSLGKITDVSDKLTKAQKEDGAALKIKVDSNTYVLDKDFAGFGADTYAKDTHILYVQSGAKVLASQVAETVKGEVTATKGTDAKIDGTYYKTVKSVKVGDTGTFYLNAAGMIMDADSTSKSDAYAYVYSVVKDSKATSEGLSGTTYTAYFVKADGTKDSAVLDKADDLANAIESGKKATDKFSASQTNTSVVIAYSINSDKELVVEVAKDKIDAMSTVTKATSISKDAAALTSSSTQFIFTYANKDNTKQEVALATGYKNVDVTDVSKATYVYTLKDDGKTVDEVLYVFVSAENGSVTSGASVAVFTTGDAEVTKVDGTNYYAYAVVINGEESTLTFKGTDPKVAKGAVKAYYLDGEYAKLEEAGKQPTEVKSVSSATKDYIDFDGKKQYNLGGDETIYTITLEYKDETNFKAGKIDTVTVSEGGTVEAGDTVVYTLKDSKLNLVFVFDYVY